MSQIKFYNRTPVPVEMHKVKIVQKLSLLPARERLAKLEEAGFLTRTPDPADRRSLLVSPTEKAIALLPVLRDVGGTWRELLTADFTEEETKLFEDLLQRAMQNAQAAIREEETE